MVVCSCTAKFEEHEDCMVCMEQLQIMAQQCGENPEYYAKKEFLMMELYLLKFFEWSVSHPTSIYFAEYFLSVEDMEVEEENPCRCTSSASPFGSEQDGEAMRTQVDRLTSCFLEATLRGMVLKCPCSRFHVMYMHISIVCMCPCSLPWKNM